MWDTDLIALWRGEDGASGIKKLRRNHQSGRYINKFAQLHFDVVGTRMAISLHGRAAAVAAASVCTDAAM